MSVSATVSEVTATERLVAFVRVADVIVLFDPLRTPPWPGVRFAIDPVEVWTAIQHGETMPDPVGIGRYHLYRGSGMREADAVSKTRWEHVGRIAHLVENPADDPIEIDFEEEDDLRLPVVPRLAIVDGHHRLAAAWLREIWGMDPVGGRLEVVVLCAAEVFHDAFADAVVTPTPSTPSFGTNRG